MATPDDTAAGLVQSVALWEAAQLRNAFTSAGLTGLRTAHSLVLLPLDDGPLRASDMSTRLGVSRQAISVVIATLEKHDYLQRVADPGDARAKLIELTERGRAAVALMRATGRAIEAEWTERLGRDRLSQLRLTLAQLVSPS